MKRTIRPLNRKQNSKTIIVVFSCFIISRKPTYNQGSDIKMAVMQLKDKNTKKPIKDKQGRSWYFKTYYTSLTGERKQYKSKKFISKHEAEEAERIFILNSTNDKIEGKSLSIEDILNSYEKEKKDEVKITTYNNYKKYHKYLKPIFKIKVTNFKINNFKSWKQYINSFSLSTNYKNSIYRFLKSALLYAEEMYNISLNEVIKKMKGFSNPNEIKKEMQFWTYEEFSSFIKQETELKYKSFFEILYYCGLRKGEANAITWKDINFNNHTITINKNITLKIKGKKWIILPPKTKSSVRTLLLPRVLEESLKMLYNEYYKYKNFNEDWFVFGGIEPLKDTTIETHKNKNCKLSGVKQIRIHDFRHSCASLLIKNSASISLVAKYLGHSDISTTLNTYTHLYKNEMGEIIEIINKLEKRK